MSNLFVCLFLVYSNRCLPNGFGSAPVSSLSCGGGGRLQGSRGAGCGDESEEQA